MFKFPDEPHDKVAAGRLPLFSIFAHEAAIANGMIMASVLFLDSLMRIFAF